MSRARVTASRIIETLKEVPDVIYVALKYPVLLAIFGFNGSVVLPLLIVGLAKVRPHRDTPVLGCRVTNNLHGCQGSIETDKAAASP